MQPKISFGLLLLNSCLNPLLFAEYQVLEFSLDSSVLCETLPSNLRDIIDKAKDEHKDLPENALEKAIYKILQANSKNCDKTQMKILVNIILRPNELMALLRINPKDFFMIFSVH